MVSFIRELHIQGLRKFEDLKVCFNDHMNIIVGENEAGKSTILEAIKIVLYQMYRNSDKSILRDLFNQNQVQKFKKQPSIDTLPRIEISVTLNLSTDNPRNIDFCGDNENMGVRFLCQYNPEIEPEMEGFIKEGKIPYEYYDLTWKTFSGRTYYAAKRPLVLLSIDTSLNTATNSFNNYNRDVFTATFDEVKRMELRNKFRSNIDTLLEDEDFKIRDEARKFGIDSKKVILENVLSIFENDVALENKGSGMENLIKMDIALKKKENVNVILIEEPENHLSYTNLRLMLDKIESTYDSSQVILTTHNNLIASRLNLNNVLWITENESKSLSDIDEDTATFFSKADNNSFLQFLLSPKCILVEGATEAMLIPMFFKDITGKSIEECNVDVISCNGISYERYLKIAQKTSKRIAVITDNDKNGDRIKKASEFNDNHGIQHIFMDNSIDNWTWEVCIFNSNELIIKSLINVKKGAKYPYHNQVMDSPFLGKMLNNKAETAYQMLMSNQKFDIPRYVKDAILWLEK